MLTSRLFFLAPARPVFRLRGGGRLRRRRNPLLRRRRSTACKKIFKHRGHYQSEADLGNVSGNELGSEMHLGTLAAWRLPPRGQRRTPKGPIQYMAVSDEERVGQADPTGCCHCVGKP